MTLGTIGALHGVKGAAARGRAAAAGMIVVDEGAGQQQQQGQASASKVSEEKQGEEQPYGQQGDSEELSLDSFDSLPLAQRSQPMEAWDAVLSNPVLRRLTVKVMQPWLSQGGVPAGQGSQEEGAGHAEQRGWPSAKRDGVLAVWDQVRAGGGSMPRRHQTVVHRMRCGISSGQA